MRVIIMEGEKRCWQADCASHARLGPASVSGETSMADITHSSAFEKYMHSFAWFFFSRDPPRM